MLPWFSYILAEAIGQKQEDKTLDSPSVHILISCNKNICTLQITDTTGSHQFPAMQRLSISKGHAFVLVYSITSKQSLQELRWGERTRIPYLPK